MQTGSDRWVLEGQCLGSTGRKKGGWGGQVGEWDRVEVPWVNMHEVNMNWVASRGLSSRGSHAPYALPAAAATGSLTGLSSGPPALAVNLVSPPCAPPTAPCLLGPAGKGAGDVAAESSHNDHPLSQFPKKLVY